MTANEIAKAIRIGNFSNEDLNQIVDSIKFARADLMHQNIRTLSVGASVQFTSSKTGKNVTGEVKKINRKFVIVREHGMNFGNWRVPANMLTVI